MTTHAPEVEMSGGMAGLEDARDDRGNFGAFEPSGAGCGGIRETVDGEELWALGGPEAGIGGNRQGIDQPPCQKAGLAFGHPVRKALWGSQVREWISRGVFLRLIWTRGLHPRSGDWPIPTSDSAR